MINEIWKPIINHEELYEISNYGKVKRLIGYRCRKERIIKSNKRKDYGYLYLSLCKDKIAKTYLVHKLVIETFIGPCPNGMEICHNNGDPENNYIGNLRYDTHKNNMIDSMKHGTRWKCKGELHPGSKLKDIEIIDIIKKLKDGIQHSVIAKEFCVSRECITAINRGKRWIHITGGKKVNNLYNRVKNKKSDFYNRVNRKIYEKDKTNIKNLLKNGVKQKDIAKLFNVDPSQISRINTEDK